MYYFASLSIFKDGGAHCAALRAYMRDAIKFAVLEESQPLS